MKKIIKIITWSFSGIILLIVSAIIFFNHYAGDIASARLEKYLENSPLPGHRITFSNFIFNIQQRSINIDSISISRDSTFENYPDPANNAFRINLHLKYIRVKGIGFYSLLIRHMLKVDSVIINEPVGEIILGNARADSRQENDAIDSQSVTGKKAPFLKRLKIGEFYIRGGKIILRKTPGDSIYQADSINLAVTRFKADLIPKAGNPIPVSFTRLFLQWYYPEIFTGLK